MLGQEREVERVSFAKSGGLGKTPCVKAKISTMTPSTTSKSDSMKNAAATVG